MRTIEKFERHPGRQQRRPQWQLHKYLFGDLPLALIVFTIYCCCCCGYCNAGPTVVEGGGQGRGLDGGPFSIQQQQQQQQHQHQSSLQSQYKYQPVPYQMQAQQQQQQQHLQQQQYEYQQMLMQLREEAYGQQPMQRSASTEHTDGQLAPTQSQLLKTGASLVVGGDSSSPDSNYTDDFQGATAQRRSNGAPPRKRKRRPQTLPNGEISSSKPHCKEHSAKYWRGQVDDDKAAMTASREETRATASPSYTRRKHAAAGASIREPLAALEKEQKLYEQRDKQRQQQQQQQKRQQPPATHASEEPREADKSYRRPYGHTKKDFFSLPAATTVDDTVAAAMHTETTPAQRLGASHLKNLLKNADGLSLSEILQEKNLSLDDLLRGKQTALLALQTTTSAAAKTKGEQPFARPLKPMRKYGAATSTAATSREVVSPATSPEESEDPTGDGSGERPGRNKLKVKALQQRLKPFGTASRAASSPLLHQIDNVTTRKRDSPTLPTSTTSTTTTTTTTTTRMPLYKKRLSQRPTLKPPSLLKVSTVAPPSSTTTKEPAFKQPAFKEATFRMPNFKEPSPKEASLEPSSRESPSTEPPFEDTTFKEPNSKDYNVKDPTTSTAKPHFAEDSSEDADSFELDDEDEDFDITTPQASEIHTHREPQIEDVVQKIYSKGSAEDRSAERQTTMLIEAVNKATTTARARAYGSTTPVTTERTATTSETPSSSSLSAVSSTEASSSSPSTTTPRPRVRFGNNFKSNSIESEGSGLEHSKGDTDADGLENYFDEATAKFNEDPGSSEDTGKLVERYPAKPTGYLEYSVPDVDGIDDRTDLLELIEDRRSGNRLFKVLEQRNMTLEELIEHRKRGASQLHLSTILQNQSRFFPGQKVVLQDNMDIVTAFENFPHFNLIDLKSVKPDDIKTDSQGSSYFTSIIDIEPTDEVYRDEKGNAVGDKAGQIETAYASEKAIGFFPAFTNLALATLTSSTRRMPGDSKRQPFYLAQPKMLLESQELEDIDLSADGLNETISLQLQDDEQPPSHQTTHSDTVEAIENEVARAHDLIDLELSGHGFKRSPSAVQAASMLQSNLYTSLPAGIRSAIVASTAIVLTAMATFAVIFMAIRWRQQRQRKTYFSKAYNSMKSRLQQMGANGPSAAAPLTASQISRPQMTSTTNTSSSCSSLRDMEELVMGSRSTKVCSVATLSTGAPALHRQSSLVFGSRGNLSQLNATTSCVEAKGSTSHIQVAVHGLGARSLLGSAAGSTTSLAMSLNNGLSVSTTKLNAMDPRAPEVQEYLFHALRKSY